MQNNKNQPGNKPGSQRIDWEVGITAMQDIYIKFANGEQHFKCTMDEVTAEKMGAALTDAARKLLKGGTTLQ